MSLNLSAQCYLRAFSDNLPIDGGLAHREALVGCGLDYSLGILDRIDDFVDRTLATHPAIGECLAGDRGTQNSVFLLAFYAGEVLARALRRTPVWTSGNPAQPAPEKLPIALRGLRGSLLWHFHVSGAATVYAPLASLLDHLFTAPAPGLGAAARACLGANLTHTLPVPAVARGTRRQLASGAGRRAACGDRGCASRAAPGDARLGHHGNRRTA